MVLASMVTVTQDFVGANLDGTGMTAHTKPHARKLVRF